MGFIKRGTGEVIPDPNKKTAARGDWSEEDQEALEAENDAADAEQG